MSGWWSSWFRGGRGASVGPVRWVVLDVETSGLDARRDRLLAIAALAVVVDWTHGRLDLRLGDSFEVVLRQQEVSSRDNILLHGIGVKSQLGGVDPVQALQAFEAYAGDSPLLAFHSAFDEALIGRHMQMHLGRGLANAWLDIEDLCAVTHPQAKARSLDEWMDQFGIACAQRHQAAADTLAECELLQRIWPRVAAECKGWADVMRLARRRRWLVTG